MPGRRTCTVWVLTFLTLQDAASNYLTVPLVDNFRNIIPLGAHREIYKTTDASACPTNNGWRQSIAASEDIKRPWTLGVGTSWSHWVYSDQAGWDRYALHSPNECGVAPATGGVYPGESPINVDFDNALDADVAVASALESVGSAGGPQIELSGFNFDRSGLSLNNDGHGSTVTIGVCRDSAADCGAIANFGAWPKTLRGIAIGDHNDTYVFMRHTGARRAPSRSLRRLRDPLCAVVRVDDGCCARVCTWVCVGRPVAPLIVALIVMNHNESVG